MLRKTNWLLILLGVCFVFFYPVILGKIPFPGDLLISEYSPWKYYSFLGYAAGGYPEKFQYFDVIRQMYPWTTFVIQSLRSFQFPLWNPYNFSGSPLFANSQSAVLYPLHVLYFILPQYSAWTLLVMLQPLLSSIFTYLFARKIGIGKWGSILASIVFSYSLFMSVFLEYNTIGHVIIFLPFLLWMAELLFEKKTFWRIVGFAFGVSFAALAGHIQVFGFVLLFVGTYVLWKLFQMKTSRVKSGVLFVCLFFLGIGIASIQLFPTFELINNAARGSQEYSFLIKNLLLQWYQFILFLSPDIFGNPATKSYLFVDSYPGNAIYVGVIPFILSIVGITQWKKVKSIHFFTVAMIVLVILFFNSPITELFYKLKIPFLSTGSPTNAIFLLSFSLSILAGFGLEEFFRKQDKKVFITAGIICFAFFVLLGIFRITHTPMIIKNALYSVLVFIAFFVLSFGTVIFSKYKKIFFSLLILLTVLDLFYFSQKFNPFVDKALVFPNTSTISFLKTTTKNNRFWGYGNAGIAPNFATQYQLFDADGYDPLYPKLYGVFINSIKEGRITNNFSDINRSDAALPSVFTADDLVKNENEIKALNLLDIRYIVSKNDPKVYELPTEQFTLLPNSTDAQIFLNKYAYDRAFLVYQQKQYGSDKEFGNLFYAKTFDPKQTVLLKKEVPLQGEGVGNASIFSYTPNVVTIKTTSTKSAILVMTDTYYPGWKAFVDNKETKIFPADLAFRAVQVPAGGHTVTFRYQPYSFSLGIIFSILSIGITLIGAVIVSKKYI